MKSALDKLGIKAGMRIGLMNAPHCLFESLASLPPDVRVKTGHLSNESFVLAFVQNKRDIDRLAPMAIACSSPEGALWFAYPKKSGAIQTDITRDFGWDALSEREYRPISQVSLNETWTGFRFRPIALVKKRS